MPFSSSFPFTENFIFSNGSREKSDGDRARFLRLLFTVPWAKSILNFSAPTSVGVNPSMSCPRLLAELIGEDVSSLVLNLSNFPELPGERGSSSLLNLKASISAEFFKRSTLPLSKHYQFQLQLLQTN